MNAVRRQPSEPETRVGNCCGCNAYPVLLFKLQGIFRYRCASCFEHETGHRHYLTPCSTCNGSGLRSVRYGGDGYGDRCAALADADDQACPECNPDYSRVRP